MSAIRQASAPQPIYITQGMFDKLLEYSCSLPTGTALGKVWKCRRPYKGDNPIWYLGRYVEHQDPLLVAIEWRLVEISTPFEVAVTFDAKAWGLA